MNRFESSVEWVRNFLPANKTKKESVIEKNRAKVEDLMGNEYYKRVEMWKGQIAKGIAGEYGKEYIFTDKELGIQNMRAGGIIFVTLDKKSSLLNSPFFLESFDDKEFTRKEGEVNVVYSMTLEDDAETVE